MHQGGGLQRVATALVSQATAGETPQFVVQRRGQLVQGAFGRRRGLFHDEEAYDSGRATCEATSIAEAITGVMPPPGRVQWPTR